ncbi:conserved hypothetical protein [Pectobacterium atrosepticum SCRI1043]|uniref:Uncharacterized protein n=1 Tax=Pectobacterium atrosepticum (strain SCRI 1043 / ATCC BAA-672) TaxID=218491 RepID=Q6D2H1_PECAS|nr:hypothetical protein KCQ_00845 [Pectobacterium atrosepticum ICMP 1526]CAG76023.1 conserved hypothetical protein [Pectobacterium atrosepticum SCRI1043]
MQAYGVDAAVHTRKIRAELARQGTLIGSYDAMQAGHERFPGFLTTHLIMNIIHL